MWLQSEAVKASQQLYCGQPGLPPCLPGLRSRQPVGGGGRAGFTPPLWAVLTCFTIHLIELL